MIELINIKKSDYWDRIVKSFPCYDVYYLSSYVKAFQKHGDGEPHLFYYNKDGLECIWVMMIRDIASDIRFKDIIKTRSYYDIISPYGYGGGVVKGNIDNDNLKLLCKQYTNFLYNEGVISSFTRYHPLLNNAEYFKNYLNIEEIGLTITIDISSKDIIWSNVSSKNRNMIRKALKYGIRVEHGKDYSLLQLFQGIYNETMLRDQADSYYYFNNSFYDSIFFDLEDNYELFYAIYNNKIISMAIILYANEKIHYHLSGTLYEYRNLAPNNLLLYSVACWGNDHGFKKFHLGGGIASSIDNLYKFKQAFNTKSSNKFYVGKDIINQNKYDYLVEMRKKSDKYFDINKLFFPLYRS